MPEIHYEFVRTAPVEAIVELYRAGGWWEESPEARAVIEDMIRGSFCFMQARDSQGRIVAMGRAISDGASDAYIQDVVVLEGFRGLGIGRELIRRLTRFCLEHKIGWIGLVAEPGTQEFYEDLGFRELEGYRAMRYIKQA
jgi:ribosomal protein S18 acetylase RimI-like enzyme